MVDNACREFLFVSEFFILDATSALEIFNNIFGKTVQLLVKHTDSHISDSFDCISIFLCIHLVQVHYSSNPSFDKSVSHSILYLQRYQLLCHKRCVAGLDKYWETLAGVLWPRLNTVRYTLLCFLGTSPALFVCLFVWIVLISSGKPLLGWPRLSHSQ